MGTVMVLKNVKNKSGLQTVPKVDMLLCISAAVLLYCTLVKKGQMHACMLFAITFPSEIASCNCRARHINKNVSWVEGTLLSQLCQRCDCEMDKKCFHCIKNSLAPTGPVFLKLWSPGMTAWYLLARGQFRDLNTYNSYNVLTVKFRCPFFICFCLWLSQKHNTLLC